MAPGSALVFVVYRQKRMRMNVGEDELVEELKERVRTEFGIGSDEGPAGAHIQDKKVLALSYAGAILCDDWVFSDIAIPSGATLKAVRNEELKPSILIRCLFNNRTLPVYEAINTRISTGATLRDIVSRKVGLPVSAFQVISAKGLEIFDRHLLEDYGLDKPGSMVNLEIWEGWSDLISAAIGGLTSRLFPLLSKDETLAKYQMRVVLYIAAHFGYVDMAVGLMRKGAKPGDAVGEHPAREWCDPTLRHRNCLKTAIHEAAECGQLEVLRAFVVQDLCSVYARDADDLTPLNIALRRQHKECAAFLLAKQWSKVPYNAKEAIPLSVYSQLRQWADRSKDKVVGSSGQGGAAGGKSPSKLGPRRVPPRVGSLLGQGVVLDGYPPSRNLSKLVIEERRRRRQMDREVNAAEELVWNRLDSLKLPSIHREDAQKAKSEKRKKGDEESGSNDRHPKGSTKTKTNRPRNKTEASGTNEGEFQLPRIHPKHKSSKSSINFGREGIYLNIGHRAVRSSEDILENSQRRSLQPSSVRRKRPRRLNDALTSLRPSPGSPLFSEGFMRNKQYVSYSPRATIQSFEQRLGLSTDEYARRCLDLAQSFSEKPWLKRVEQAVRIASKGVKKVFDGQRHILASEAALDISSP